MVKRKYVLNKNRKYRKKNGWYYNRQLIFFWYVFFDESNYIFHFLKKEKIKHINSRKNKKEFIFGSIIF
jgi:hypothetical protein